MVCSSNKHHSRSSLSDRSGGQSFRGAVLLGLGIGMLALQPAMNGPIPPRAAAALLCASALLIVALPGMYTAQASASGLVGLVGHALLTLGLLLLVMLAATPLLYPSFNPAPPENLALFVLGIALTAGLLLTGLATFRARVFPRPAAVLVLVATAGFFFDFFVAEFLPAVVLRAGSALFGAVLALGFGWIGVFLWRHA